MKNIFEVSGKELETVVGGKVYSDEAAAMGFINGIPVLGSTFATYNTVKSDNPKSKAAEVGACVTLGVSAVSSLGLMGIGAGLLKFKQWLNARSKKAKAREMRELIDMAKNIK